MPASMRTGGELGLNLALNTAGTAIIRATPPDSALADGALLCGDTVCAINGNRVNATAVSTAEYALLTGQPVKFEVLRNAKPVTVTLRAKHASASHRGLTSTELAMRKEMIGKRRAQKIRNAATLAARTKNR